ncbi:MAG: hypothetical protein DPW21_00740 [Anaerolineae bacterium]|nr:hypothetical protein [Chloroflexi bacterium CFX2]MCQ3945207.1 hypothetical protein [Anaerolineae bacterium]
MNKLHGKRGGFADHLTHHPPSELNDQIEQWTCGHSQRARCNPVPHHAQPGIVIAEKSSPVIERQAQEE